ncbi:MAG: nickel pincer cofactor biosynthesis protein LarB [Lachnospiraceae bacterium]|nr:nickel pincer cofactor biosynthesis protein LarB [Lachnospiraceae bacterium]
MEKKELNALLRQVASGDLSVEAAMRKFREAPFKGSALSGLSDPEASENPGFEDLGFAKLDHHRALRQGIAEVIYGAGKTPEQIRDIAMTMMARGQKRVLTTRMSPEAAELMQQVSSSAPVQIPFRYDSLSRIGILGEMPVPDGRGNIVVATGGTSDMPVAEEAALTAEVLGNRVLRLYDVGVAGLHRLLSHMDEIMDAQVIIAIAGMEGALASVIGGLADCPVVAVPTSVGYGASFHGISALLSMLNSCASGVSVVNIDNGFGAGYYASMINHIGMN